MREPFSLWSVSRANRVFLELNLLPSPHGSRVTSIHECVWFRPSLCEDLSLPGTGTVAIFDLDIIYPLLHEMGLIKEKEIFLGNLILFALFWEYCGARPGSSIGGDHGSRSIVGQGYSHGSSRRYRAFLRHRLVEGLGLH